MQVLHPGRVGTCAISRFHLCFYYLFLAFASIETHVSVDSLIVINIKVLPETFHRQRFPTVLARKARKAISSFIEQQYVYTPYRERFNYRIYSNKRRGAY